MSTSAGIVLASAASSSGNTDSATASSVSSAPETASASVSSALARTSCTFSTTATTATERSARRVGLTCGRRARRSANARGWIDGSASSRSHRRASANERVDMRATVACTT